FRFPKANEATWLATANDYLRVQAGSSYEASLTYHDDKQKLQLSVYDLILNNEIAFNPEDTPTQPFGSFTNFSKTDRLGATVADRYFVTTKLNVNGELNYVLPTFSG